MAIKYGKTEVKKIAQVIDQDYETVEQAAEAVLAAAVEIVEARGKFAVVGQLRFSGQLGGYLDADDAFASKVCLGLFSTRGDADKAAQGLYFSNRTNETFRSWVLPVDYRTPSEVFQARKDFHDKRAEEARAVEAERLREIVDTGGKAREEEALAYWKDREPTIKRRAAA